MEIYEAQCAIKYQYYAYKDSWEQARLIAYITAQCNSTKRLSQDDIISFYWENKEEDELTDKEIDNFANYAKQVLNGTK